MQGELNPNLDNSFSGINNLIRIIIKVTKVHTWKKTQTRGELFFDFGLVFAISRRFSTRCVVFRHLRRQPVAGMPTFFRL